MTTNDPTAPENPIPAGFRAGYVAVVGLPNAGKSTLLNQLLQFKISIVTRRPQTTRKNLLGILNGEDYQIVFIDTPGILKPRYNLQRFMMKQVSAAIADADVLVYLIDVKDHRQRPVDLQRQLAEAQGKPVILLLNKIDLVPDKRNLLPLIGDYHRVHPFKAIIPVSAEKNDGLDQLLQVLTGCLPESPPYYPTDYLSDQQERFFVAEIIREKIFTHFGEEIPYACHVEIEAFEEKENGKDYIRAIVVVEKDTQKSILIGKNGEALKKVGQVARGDIEVFLGRKVFLELFVKVRRDWRRKDGMLKDMGYS